MAEKRKIKVPTGAVLSKYLRVLAVEIETVDNDGDPVTKAEALAKLVWQHALGFKTKDVKDEAKEVYTPPAVWAIELLYNRIEGKIPLAVVEDNARGLADKVGDLAKAKINAAAKAAAGEDEKEDDGTGDDQA
jgi:hypothetical protein